MRIKLATVTVMTVLISIILFAIPLSFFIRHTYYSGVDKRAVYEAQTNAAALQLEDLAKADGLNEWLRSAETDQVPLRIVVPSGRSYGHDFTCPEANSKFEQGVEVETCGVYRVAMTHVATSHLGNIKIYAGVNTTSTTQNWHRTILIICLGVVTLPLLAALIADRLARSVVRSVSNLVQTSNRLSEGDLSAQPEISGPKEMRALGQSFHSLGERIRTMLSDERDNVADLSHRLRTPIASLLLQAEGLADPNESRRMMDAAHSLNEEVTKIIRHAQQTPLLKPFGGAECDLGEVAVDRLEFWSILAEEQGRPIRLSVCDESCVIPVHLDDAQTVIDVLIGNAFTYTDERCIIELDVRRDQNTVILTVQDDGPGFISPSAVERGKSSGGSSGLGLDIVRKIAVGAGGNIFLSSREPTGALVEVAFALKRG